MGLIPIDRMWERTEIARQDSDTTLFLTLLYFGEMVLKLVGAGFIAAVEDDRERHRFRQIHRLVRADGIGDWVAAVDDVLTGPAAQHLIEQARDEQSALTSKNGPDTWQHEAVRQMSACVTIADPAYDGKLPVKVDARRWLAMFVMLRNKTRGHGAVPSETFSLMSRSLEQSIKVFTDNFNLFRRPVAPH